jgi:hypothetical protein
MSSISVQFILSFASIQMDILYGWIENKSAGLNWLVTFHVVQRVKLIPAEPHNFMKLKLTQNSIQLLANTILMVVSLLKDIPDCKIRKDPDFRFIGQIFLVSLRRTVFALELIAIRSISHIAL